jgi:hypothetical protein
VVSAITTYRSEAERREESKNPSRVFQKRPKFLRDQPLLTTYHSFSDVSCSMQVALSHLSLLVWSKLVPHVGLRWKGKNSPQKILAFYPQKFWSKKKLTNRCFLTTPQLGLLETCAVIVVLSKVYHMAYQKLWWHVCVKSSGAGNVAEPKITKMKKWSRSCQNPKLPGDRPLITSATYHLPTKYISNGGTCICDYFGRFGAAVLSGMTTY